MDRFYVRTAEDLIRARHHALIQPEVPVGFDIETESLHPHAMIAGFSIHVPNEGVSFYVPLHHFAPDGTLTGWDLHADSEDWQWLNSLRVITYHGAFDLGRFRYHYPRYQPLPVGDGQLAAKMLQVKRWVSLKDLAEDLGITEKTISFQEVMGEGNFDFTKAPLDEKTLEYTCQDAELAVSVEAAIRQKHLKLKTYPGFYQVYALECRMSPILGEMGNFGLPFDKEGFLAHVDELKIEAQEQFLDICEMLSRAPDDFNLASSQRLSAALFNKTDHVAKELKKTQHEDLEFPGLGLKPPTRKGKSGAYSTAADNLMTIEDQHPVIPALLAWKKGNSFLTRDAKLVDKWVENDHIYPNFVQVGEDSTARIYAKDPNVLGLSRASRKLMRPEFECCYCHVDYSAAEFRLAMFFANEEGMLKALEDGLDAHSYTYAQMAGCSIDAVSPEQRNTGKILNFASIFGSGGFSIGRALGITFRDAEDLLEVFWDSYPKLRQWYDYRQGYARDHARTYTVLGRVRRLPEVFAKDWGVKNSAFRKAVNTATQGSCGDVLKVAMLNFDIDRRLEDSPLNAYYGRMIVPVFDACLLSFHENAMDDRILLETAIRRVFEVEVAITPDSDVAIDRIPRTMKLPVDIGWSSENWFEAMKA